MFLLTTNILPIFLIFLTSMFLGIKIRTMWMTPFYLFLGVIIYVFKSQLNLKKLKEFYSVFLFLFILFSSLPLYFFKPDKRTDYPGKEIAD